MQPFRSQMWATYTFRDHRVRIIQQWHDPFGRPMVRIETISKADALADGMPDAVFMDEAIPVEDPAMHEQTDDRTAE